MPTAAPSHCNAQGCLYDSDPGTLGIYCLAHWELLTPACQKLLRSEHQRMGGQNSPRWLDLLRVSNELLIREEAQRAAMEELGFRPKSEARVS